MMRYLYIFGGALAMSLTWLFFIIAVANGVFDLVFGSLLIALVFLLLFGIGLMISAKIFPRRQ